MADTMIFISYRRNDSIGTAGRLYDRLAQAFGRNNLFMDVEHVPAGVDFVDYLHSQVAACDVFLAVIGPNWLEAKDDDGRRRLDNPDDFVTIEIAAALARNIRVIPVLLDDARIPKADKLPPSLKPLVRRNAVEIRNTQFGRDAEALIGKIRERLTKRRRSARPKPKQAPKPSTLPREQTRFYLYISDAKVDMLFGQIPPALLKRLAAELTVDLGETRFSRVALVSRFLSNQNLVGGVRDPAQYFAAEAAPMRWGVVGRNETRGAPGIVFFAGDVESTRVFLTGSPHHVVGVAPGARVGGPHSPIAAARTLLGRF
jgi:TIR domain